MAFSNFLLSASGFSVFFGDSIACAGTFFSSTFFSSTCFSSFDFSGFLSSFLGCSSAFFCRETSADHHFLTQKKPRFFSLN